MRRLFSILLISFAFFPFTVVAQRQAGVVRTICRKGTPGVPLANVRIQVSGYNQVITDSKGTFSVLLDGKKIGDPFSFDKISKVGFSLLDDSNIGRRFPVSNVPIEIVMFNNAEMQAEKAKIALKISEQIENKYMSKVDSLEQKLAEGSIVIAEYKEQTESLDKLYGLLYEKLSEVAERYACTDWEYFSELDQKIINYIEDGDFEAASRLIDSKGDIDSRILDQQRADQQAMVLEEKVAEMEALVNKTKEENEKNRQVLCQDIMHKYEISLHSFSFDDAQLYLNKLVTVDSLNPKTLDAYGDFLRDQITDSPRAKEYYTKAYNLRLEEFEENHPQIAVSCINLGSVSNRDEEKESYFKKALEIRRNWYGDIDPLVAEVYMYLGELYFNMGHSNQGDKDLYDLAEEYYKNAINVMEASFDGYNEKTGQAYVVLGQLYIHMKKFELAVEALNKGKCIYAETISELNPKMAQLYYHLGNSYAFQGDYENAGVEWKKAAELNSVFYGEDNPSLMGIYHNMGCLYAEMKQFDLSYAYFQKALACEMRSYSYGNEVQSSIAFTLSSLASTYAAAGEYENAIETIDNAIQYYSKPEYLLAKGEYLINVGHVDEAKVIADMLVKSQREFVKEHKSSPLFSRKGNR